MKKKIKIGIIVAIIIGIVLFIALNISTESEQYVENESGIQAEIEPAEEIADERDYSTTVRLYFFDSTSGIMSAEDRKIDARNLIDNPYIYVLNLLMDGPEKGNLETAIPKGTKVNSASLQGDTLNVDLSEEFLQGSGTNPLYSIVNTMYEFNEVNSIKFTINGEEKDGMREKFVKAE